MRLIEKKKSRWNSTKARNVAIMTFACLMIFSTPAFATGAVISQINVIKDLVLNIVTAIGAIVLVWGIFEFAFSYQSHDTAQQTTALKKVVSGIVMVGAPIILGALGA